MLSKRLLQIASLIDKDKVVYDVGSDHGLLPCFLLKENIAKKAYAVDNKIGPLNRAIETINKYGLNDRVIPILSNGIDDIEEDVNIITISGMGFYTVEKIFKDKDLSPYEKIIVQVNRNTDLLRKYISDHHFKIIDERVVYDIFYYEIVVFNTDYHEAYSDLEIKYGPILLKNRDEVFIEYLKWQLEQYNKIYLVSKNNDTYEKIKEIRYVLDIMVNGK